jgi:hypothetical protein
MSLQGLLSQLQAAVRIPHRKYVVQSFNNNSTFASTSLSSAHTNTVAAFLVYSTQFKSHLRL